MKITTFILPLKVRKGKDQCKQQLQESERPNAAQNERKIIGDGAIKLQINVCTQNELNALFPVLISLPLPQTKIVLLTKSVH